MNIWYRLWVYLLPLPMWVFEYFMRTAMDNPDAKNFFPASLAATALGLVIPTLSPKAVPQQAGINIPAGLMFVNQKDEHVRRAGMMALFFGTPLWLGTVYLSIGGKWPSGWYFADVDQKFWIGLILYAGAFGLNEWKERI